MITIEQIQKLDQKVQTAVKRIATLKSENAGLQAKLDDYQKRIGELEVLIERFKKDQTEIEKGIIRALEQLDHLEDTLDEKDSTEARDAEKADEQEEPPAKTEEAPEDQPDEQEENELDIF
jgi:chemotaxis protein histidine kinase CheA